MSSERHGDDGDVSADASSAVVIATRTPTIKARAMRRAFIALFRSYVSKSARRVERLLDVADDVGLRLDADRQAQETFRNPAFFTDLFRDRAVRHARRMTDERLDAAQAFREREHFRLRCERMRTLRSAAQHERYHAAEAAHLSLRKLVLWMGGQPRII